MTDRLTDGSDKGREQLADCAAYWIGYGEGRMRRRGRGRGMQVPIAMSMVAVVRPLRSNHLSEYMGPRTWNTGCATAANIFGAKKMSGGEQK